jgi:hypothetical protein
MEENVKPTEVISDITGVTSTGIIDAILAGERDPNKLAALLRHERCHNDEQTSVLALEGDWRVEQHPSRPPTPNPLISSVRLSTARQPTHHAVHPPSTTRFCPVT